MNPELQERAREVVEQLQWLGSEYRDVALEAFKDLERLDPETVKLALEAFDSRAGAAAWFGDRVPSLGNWTPWERLSQGRVDWVRRILNAIIYGIPM